MEYRSSWSFREVPGISEKFRPNRREQNRTEQKGVMMPKVGKKVYKSVKKAKAAAKKTGKVLTYTKPVKAYKK